MDKSYQDRKNKTRVKALLTGALAHIINDGFTDMLYVFFPIWQIQFSLTFAQIGLFKTLFSGVMAAFQIPTGILASHIGGMRLLLLGTVRSGFNRKFCVAKGSPISEILDGEP